MKPLKFKKSDYLFIKEKFPSFYKVLSKKAKLVDGEYQIALANMDEYDIYFDACGDELMEALTPDNSELSEDGLRLEAAWDYADREGFPLDEKN